MGLLQTSGRLFLSTYPLYTPLMQRMRLLATWSKPQRSFIYCSVGGIPFIPLSNTYGLAVLLGALVV